jgi:hypothetical protein
MCTINPSRSDSLIEVIGKKGFNLTERGDYSGTEMALKQKMHWRWGVLLWDKVEA